MGEKLRIAIIGLGSRGKNAYGTELLTLQDRAVVTAVADPNEERLKIGADEHNVPEERRFHSAEELLAQPKLADIAIICTQDRQHVPHAVAALRKGYDILMEKPISPFLSQLQEIVRVAREEKRRVVVCHVLRYTPFFQLIKQTIDSGRLGKIINIQALENVRYWHQAHSFVRGNWRRSDESSPMILAKCCHDLDYLVWLCSRQCERVSSFGSLGHFKKENAPMGSAERCLQCAAASGCPYCAPDYYLKQFRAHGDGWPQNVVAFKPTEIHEDGTDKEHLVVIIVDDFTNILVFEGVADIVGNHIDCLDNLDIAEILAHIGGEGVEGVASACNLHTTTQVR